MKHINNREQFILDWKKQYTINEAFDMSGGSGPMGNDINWGDSLVGRLFNSVFRKIGVGMDLVSINNVIKAIQREFEAIKTESQTTNINQDKISRLHISYLLEALTKAVFSGTKVLIIISITEETIDIVDESELPQDEKNECIKELEDFLKFLEQFDEEMGEPLSEELTGISKEEEENTESLSPTGGWGEKTYSGMVTMVSNLINIIENKDKVSTTAQGEKENIDKSKDQNYIKDNIIKALREVYNTPLLEIFVTIKDNSIYFREEKLASVNEKGEFIGNVGKWDSTNKRFTKDIKARIMEISRENVTNFSLHIASRLKETLGDNTVDKNVQLEQNEIKLFNEKVSGKWACMVSLKGNHYAVQIEDIDTKGQFRNDSIWKIENNEPKELKTSAGSTLISSLFKRGSIFNKQGECFVKLKEESKNSKSEPSDVSPGLTSKFQLGKYDGKDVKVLGEEGQNYKIELDGEVISVPKSLVTNIKTNESFEFIFEKTTLSEEESDANQALKRLKEFLNELITDKSKSPSIDLKFLTSIKEKATKDFMTTFGNEIKVKYNQISEDIQKKPLYVSVNEGIEMIDDALLTGPSEKAKAKGAKSSAAEKIARFASVSMLFVGEGLYGEIGEIGKSLERFNNDFQKLLNTEFVKKKVESKLFRYSDFVLINEKKTSEEVSIEIKTYYEENVNYKKWKVTKEEVEAVDKEIKESKPSGVKYDRIIRIVKLFNKAHKIHTTDVIPSARRSGKVSNRVFRNYQYVGDGSNPGRPVPEGGIEPGIGPYRNKAVFDKFEKAILSIIEDKDFRDFFSEDVKVTNLDGAKSIKAGDGKILMKFMNNLLDGDKLYKSGAQSKFFQEYFGFKVDDKDFGGKEFKETKTDDDSPVKESDLPTLKFKSFNRIESRKNSINVLIMKDKFAYLVILDKDETNVYVKYSTDFSKVNMFIKNKVEKGDLSFISKDPSSVFYASIKLKDFPIDGSKKIEINVIKAEDVRAGNINVIKSDLENLQGKFYTLVNEKGEIFTVGNVFPSTDTNNDITLSNYNTSVKPKLR